MKKPYTHTHGRHTGRTHRMILEAIKSSLAGNAVCILCPLVGYEVDHIRKQAQILWAKIGLTTPKDFLFKTVQSHDMEGRIDWKNKMLIGSYSNYKLFIDHHVWVEQFGWAINAFHEYDLKEEI